MIESSIIMYAVKVAHRINKGVVHKDAIERAPTKNLEDNQDSS